MNDNNGRITISELVSSAAANAVNMVKAIFDLRDEDVADFVPVIVPCISLSPEAMEEVVVPMIDQINESLGVDTKNVSQTHPFIPVYVSAIHAAAQVIVQQMNQHAHNADALRRGQGNKLIT